jgi:hypothetical protein
MRMVENNETRTEHQPETEDAPVYYETVHAV